jgi:hypothetical protein
VGFEIAGGEVGACMFVAVVRRIKLATEVVDVSVVAGGVLFGASRVVYVTAVTVLVVVVAVVATVVVVVAVVAMVIVIAIVVVEIVVVVVLVVVIGTFVIALVLAIVVIVVVEKDPLAGMVDLRKVVGTAGRVGSVE